MTIDQGNATLIAALIAALASVAALVPQYLEWRRSRKLRARLTGLLTEGTPVRSLEWLGRRLGISEKAVAAMLLDVGAHGVKLADGKEGAALDSRHRGG